MVKIRLRRVGAKKAPFYRVVVADSRYPRDGRFIEEIGTYDPNQEPSAVKIDAEAAAKWLNNGAQPTDVVARLFKEAGISKDAVKTVKEEAPAAEEKAAEEAPAADAPAEEVTE